MDGTFPLSCPCVIPSVCLMGDENMSWHGPKEEEKCLDNEMALQPCLYSSLLIRYPSC